jgi:plastocyanin
MPTRVSRLAVAASLLFCTGACAAAGAARPVTHRITIEGAAFTPATLNIKAGDTIIWTNKDPYPHTVTATTKDFDSDTLQPDASWKFTLSMRGEVSYTCALHPTMAGTLQVQ